MSTIYTQITDNFARLRFSESAPTSYLTAGNAARREGASVQHHVQRATRLMNADHHRDEHCALCDDSYGTGSYVNDAADCGYPSDPCKAIHWQP